MALDSCGGEHVDPDQQRTIRKNRKLFDRHRFAAASK
jgi:hypothetical protein